jgi:dTDP-4-amino-4,6-dideoxygalactose transaminase
VRVAGQRHIYNQYVIRSRDRDQLRNRLNAAGIGTEVYYPIPLHMQKCFESLGYLPEDCPQSARAALETLAIPIYPELTSSQMDRVIDGIAEFHFA